MVRLSMRSLAVMAFAVFAAASPMVDAISRPVAENAAAPAPVAAPVAQAPVAAPVAPVAPAAYNPEQKEMADMHVPVLPANAGQQMPFDMNQMRRMVPCSEEDCLQSMTAEEQDAFKRKCAELLSTQQKPTSVNGQSRVAKGGHELRFFQLNLPSPAADQRVAQTANGKAVGNRPAGKKLCCCCCCPCCCHCCCCPCCCCCCKCCHCCCCCPCCCHCCCC